MNYPRPPARVGGPLRASRLADMGSLGRGLYAKAKDLVSTPDVLRRDLITHAQRRLESVQTAQGHKQNLTRLSKLKFSAPSLEISDSPISSTIMLWLPTDNDDLLLAEYIHNPAPENLIYTYDDLYGPNADSEKIDDAMANAQRHIQGSSSMNAWKLSAAVHDIDRSVISQQIKDEIMLRSGLPAERPSYMLAMTLQANESMISGLIGRNIQDVIDLPKLIKEIVGTWIMKEMILRHETKNGMRYHFECETS